MYKLYMFPYNKLKFETFLSMMSGTVINPMNTRWGEWTVGINLHISSCKVCYSWCELV